MQNIQKLYQDLHEGKISRNQFLFQLRKDSRINSFFTSANSYDETVRILKNRGLLFEIKINENQESKVRFEKILKDGNIFQVIDRDTRGMGMSVGIRAPQDQFYMQIVDKDGKVVKNIGSHISLDGAKSYSDRFESVNEEIGSNDPETSHEGLDNLNEADLSPKAVEYIKNYIEKFDERAMAVKLVDIALKSVAGVESSDMPDTSTFANGVDEIQSLLEDAEYDSAYAMAKDTANEMLEEEGYGGLNEAKELTKGADQVNPYELEKGTYYELDCQKEGAKDTDKAKAKALKNLNKNPKYYSDLFSKSYNDKANTSDQMQIVKESLKSLIADILSEE